MPTDFTGDEAGTYVLRLLSAGLIVFAKLEVGSCLLIAGFCRRDSRVRPNNCTNDLDGEVSSHLPIVAACRL